MPESIGGIITAFGGEAGVGIGASSATAEVAATGVATGATNAALIESAVAGGTAAGYTGSAGATWAATGGAAGLNAVGALAKIAAPGLVTGGVQAALAPKRPDLPKPLPMPDPVAQEEERKRSIIEQLARRGRASTVLSDPGPGTLGG